MKCRHQLILNKQMGHRNVITISGFHCRYKEVQVMQTCPFDCVHSFCSFSCFLHLSVQVPHSVKTPFDKVFVAHQKVLDSKSVQPLYVTPLKVKGKMQIVFSIVTHSSESASVCDNNTRVNFKQRSLHQKIFSKAKYCAYLKFRCYARAFKTKVAFQILVPPI